MNRNAGPEKSKDKKPIFDRLTNQMLITMIGILSVILVGLVIVSVQVSNFQPDVEMDSSALASSSTTPTFSSSSTQSSVTTAPTLPPTTAPTLPVTPAGDNYINVGSGYIVEVIQNNVETYDGKTTDSYSHPTNNYLPKGTVDYCDRDPVYRGSTAYALLRCGYRISMEKKIYPPVKMEPEVRCYEGTLPDHNEINVASVATQGRHTIFTFDCLWKAPFYFDIAPQKYRDPNGGSDRDYSITSLTVTHVDITFCYATFFTGTIAIPADNPLFSSAEVIRNESDYTLRLYLKKTGGFYGWNAFYNEQDQLCFQFLNPAKVTAADNAYSVNLAGTTILIDVGHGGADGGAAVYNCNTCNVHLIEDDLVKSKCPTCNKAPEIDCKEEDVNMMLALAVKKELESVGATVILNRTEDVPLHGNKRQENLTTVAPDFCVAVHHDSFTDTKTRGFGTMFFTPWSQKAMELIKSHVKDSGVYTKTRGEWSVNYYMTRQTVCPVVLTENGYMTNLEDLADMQDPATVEKKAQAITHGIADYFLYINR